MGGCGDKSEAITQDSGTGDATGSAEAPWYCNDGGYSLDNGMVETEHYQLHLELDDAEEALQMARLAEAAYDAFSRSCGFQGRGLLKDSTRAHTNSTNSRER